MYGKVQYGILYGVLLFSSFNLHSNITKYKMPRSR